MARHSSWPRHLAVVAAVSLALGACASRPKPMGPAAIASPLPPPPPGAGDNRDIERSGDDMAQGAGPGSARDFVIKAGDLVYSTSTATRSAPKRGRSSTCRRRGSANINPCAFGSRATPMNVAPGNTTSPSEPVVRVRSATILSDEASTAPASTPFPTARSAPSTRPRVTRPTRSTVTPAPSSPAEPAKVCGAPAPGLRSWPRPPS